MFEIKYFKSQKVSPFAPEYDWPIWENTIEGINFQEIADLIKDKEQEVLENTQIPEDDGYTGTGLYSLTSRYNYFNVLKWENQEVKKLFEQIKLNHELFLKLLKYEKPKNKLWIKCWANILRKKQKLNTHIHMDGNFSYLCGTVALDVKETKTVFVSPFSLLSPEKDEIEIENIPGKIILFPSFLPHYTTENESEKERVTLGFDIVMEQIYDGNENLILFDDQLR